MSQWTIYHNPQCSKSRQALALLKEKGVNPEVIEYLKQNPSEPELQEIATKLKGPVSSLVRTKEDLYKELKFDLSSPQKIIQNLARHPRLIERPIVVKDNIAIIARPPELVQQLF